MAISIRRYVPWDFFKNQQNAWIYSVRCWNELIQEWMPTFPIAEPVTSGAPSWPAWDAEMLMNVKSGCQKQTVPSNPPNFVPMPND